MSGAPRPVGRLNTGSATVTHHRGSDGRASTFGQAEICGSDLLVSWVFELSACASSIRSFFIFAINFHLWHLLLILIVWVHSFR